MSSEKLKKLIRKEVSEIDTLNSNIDEFLKGFKFSNANSAKFELERFLIYLNLLFGKRMQEAQKKCAERYFDL